MCGFVCVVTRAPLQATLDEPYFDRGILRHRGPDSSNEIVLDHAYIRHWRLSIVDLSAGSDQPYGDQDSWLLYNGEIYNHQTLAASLSIDVRGDTAFLYDVCKRGVEREQLKKVRGFYSYLYIAGQGSVLTGARDPFGKKPLYYYVDDARGIAAFASEEKAIVDCLKTSEIDFGSICQYLLYKSVFHGHTYFNRIRQLAPGARFSFDARTWSFSMEYDWTTYYQMAAAEVFSVKEADDTRVTAHGLQRSVSDTLGESIAIRIPDEVSACVALSGGIDSSLLAHFAAEAPTLEHISRFVTIGFQESSCDESLRAAAIAEYLSLADKHSIVQFRDDRMLEYIKVCIANASAPLEHPHYLSYYLLCQAAAEFSKVLLTGEGADELFMGYEHYSQRGTSFAFREYLAADDENGFAGSTSGTQPFDFIRNASRIGTLRQLAVSSPMLSREYELKTHLISLLERNDKMGMANSVEVRAPFLDREMLGLCLKLSDTDLVVDGEPKHVLKELFAERFPGMRIPSRKIGFRVPFDDVFARAGTGSAMRDYCGLAARALGQECGLRLASVDAISPRLGWSLLNIGVFLDVHGYS